VCFERLLVNQLMPALISVPLSNINSVFFFSLLGTLGCLLSGAFKIFSDVFKVISALQCFLADVTLVIINNVAFNLLREFSVTNRMLIDGGFW